MDFNKIRGIILMLLPNNFVTPQPTEMCLLDFEFFTAKGYDL